MMAFVHNKVPVARNGFIHGSLLDQALDGGNVDKSGLHFVPSSDAPDRLSRQLRNVTVLRSIAPAIACGAPAREYSRHAVR